MVDLRVTCTHAQPVFNVLQCASRVRPWGHVINDVSFLDHVKHVAHSHTNTCMLICRHTCRSTHIHTLYDPVHACVRISGELLSQRRPEGVSELTCPKNSSERVNVALVYPPTPTDTPPTTPTAICPKWLWRRPSLTHPGITCMLLSDASR